MPPRKSTSSVTPADPDPNTASPFSPRPHEGASSPSQSTEQTTTATATGTVTATEQQIKARAEASANVEDHLLPRSITQRLAKSVLPPNTTIQKDALLAIQKAATVFVSYLSSHANDATLKRTVAPSDVFSAISELEFDVFRPRLEKELDVHTEIKAGKRKKGGSSSGGVDAGAAAADTGTGTGKNGEQKTADNEDGEEDTARGAKRVKRQEGPGAEQATGDGDGDETQEEDPDDDADDDIEEEEEEQDDDEDEDEEEDNEETQAEGDDINRVEDLDRDSAAKRTMDPDVAGDDSDMEDETGPGSQLRANMGLG